MVRNCLGGEKRQIEWFLINCEDGEEDSLGDDIQRDSYLRCEARDANEITEVTKKAPRL